jgi:hypothetical protein
MFKRRRESRTMPLLDNRGARADGAHVVGATDAAISYVSVFSRRPESA